MNRRTFLASAAGALFASRMSWAKDAPRDITITRVVSYELELTRPKHIGKNAYRHDHGPKAYDRVVHFYTNAGIDGFGTCWSGANECAAFLGKSPFDFFDAASKKVSGPLVRYTTPIWDLVGKILKKPVYELLGGSAGDVPVYDGSIYFTDLRPPYLNNWRDEFKREIDLSHSLGHRAFKIKVGRGKLWMVMKDGDTRDVEVVRLLRKHIGPDELLMADANDGYDLERAKRFLAETAECDLAVIEEAFPESNEQYLSLKAFMKDKGIKGLIADGENIRRPAEMQSWVEAKAVDILQGDMNLYGFEDILAEAAMAATSGAMIAPHNWGSLFGYYLQLQIGRAVPNFFRAEQDPVTCPAVITDGYKIANGRSTVPCAPGLGITINDKALADVACVHFDLKA